MSRTKVFVSYSQDDIGWLERISQHLAVLDRVGLIELWSDNRIAVGADWKREIDEALTVAKVAVLLVSPAFLGSRFVWNEEMPLIKAHSKQGMDVLPIIVRPCAWRLDEYLEGLQVRPREPLSLGSDCQVDLDLTRFTYEIAARLGRSPAATSFANEPLSDSAQDNEVEEATGDWTGYYNRTLEMRLVIREVQDGRFRAKMEYPADGMVTSVEGDVYRRWSPSDPLWVQVGGGNNEGRVLAIAFRETGYEKRGSSTTSFDGEYRALIKASIMTGAWFTGTRLVGTFTFQRTRAVTSALKGSKRSAKPHSRGDG